MFTGQPVEAEHRYQEGLALARRTGNRGQECSFLLNLGDKHRLMGDMDAAASETAAALALSRELGRYRDETLCLGNLGLIAMARQDWQAAAEYVRQALKGSLDIGDMPLAAAAVANFGQLRAAQGNIREALSIIGAALSHPAADFNTFNAVNSEMIPFLRETLSEEKIQAGIEAGKALDFDAVVQELLGDD